MHISQLIGTIFKGLESPRSESLQLRPGQIVSAQILSMLSNEEALLQIGDMKVVGKLEAKIAVGETAWLQVQNRLASGQIAMKTVQLEAFDTGVSGSIEQLVSALGLKKTTTNIEMVKTLVEQQVPLSKESAKAFESVLTELIPKGTKDSQGFNAALRALIVADKKGLPITPESIRGIAEFISEEPVDKKVSTLLKEIDSAIASKQLPFSTEQKVTLLRNQLASMFLSLHLEEGPSQQRVGSQVPSPTLMQGSPDQSLPDAGSRLSHTTSLNHEGGITNASSNGTSSIANSSEQVTRNAQVSLSEQQRPITTGKTVQEDNEATGTTESKPSNSEKVQVSLRQMGMEHEHLLKLQLTRDSNELLLKSENTVKNLILNLQQDNNLTLPALQEAADKTLNHITGQQLMLVPNQQPDSMFSQLVMQLPIEFQGQKNTASIQFEWKDQKKDGQKQVDLENCRIFFNLSMSNLGLTFVDVNIVNRIISIKIYNDSADVKDRFAPLITSLKENVEALGYRFSGISHAAIPDSNRSQKLLSSYSAMDYKGVDIRI